MLKFDVGDALTTLALRSQISNSQDLGPTFRVRILFFCEGGKRTGEVLSAYRSDNYRIFSIVNSGVPKRS